MKIRGDPKARGHQPLITKGGRRRKQPIPRIWARRSTRDLAREQVIAAAEEDFRLKVSTDDITKRIREKMNVALETHLGAKMSGPTIDSVRRTAFESLRKIEGYKTLKVEDVKAERDPEDPNKVNIEYPQPTVEYIGIDFGYSISSQEQKK